MHFIIQSNIYSDPDHYRIFDVMEELGYSYERIHLEKETTELVVETKRKDVFVYGSVRLARLAKEKTEWTPGSFYGGNHNYETHANVYSDGLLNYGARIARFGDELNWEESAEKFIKPFNEAKLFTGKCFSKTKWEQFVNEAITAPKTERLNANTLILVAKPAYVQKEARLWIVGGKVITSVYYKFNGDLPFEAAVPPEGIAFAEEMMKRFEVAPAYVMDIGWTVEGWKIVEVNCINSAGFYHANPKPVFKALELFFG